MRYACMVRAPYNNRQPSVWITHTVQNTLEEARKDQTEYEQSQHLLPGHNTTVVVYHSQEWERLVR
jgi:hypothetical protein